jgi:hypothetical protein
MNEINFLPSSFAAGQKRQVRIYREVTWVAATLVVILGWFASSRGGLNDLRDYAEAARAEAAAAKERKVERDKLEAEQVTLTKQVRIQRELVPPLKATQVVAVVQHLLPPRASLRSLTLIGKRPTPAVAPAKRDQGDRPRKGAAAAVEEPLQIELIGIAPADGDIAEFVGNLSNHALFKDVKLVFSRSTTLGDLIAREFRVELTVPMDRDYRPATEPGVQAAEVAHAD